MFLLLRHTTKARVVQRQQQCYATILMLLPINTVKGDVRKGQSY